MSDMKKAESVIIPMLKKQGDASQRNMKEVRRRMHGCFRAAGLSTLKSWILWEVIEFRLKRFAKKGYTLEQIEAELRPFFKKNMDYEGVVVPASHERAKNAVSGIIEHVHGDKVLDLGAGHGLIGEGLQECGKQVTLIDVVDYSLSNLPVLIFEEEDKIPLDDNSVDTCLIYLVLHHSDNPERLLKEAIRVTSKRIIIMEGYVENDHFAVNSVIDWFINRIVAGVDMNVPLNYRTLDKWQDIFRESGLICQHVNEVGIDDPIAPESHVLFVLDKE